SGLRRTFSFAGLSVSRAATTAFFERSLGVATQPDLRQRAIVHPALVSHFELPTVDDQLAVDVAPVQDAGRDRHLRASAADAVTLLEHDGVCYLVVAVRDLCAEAYGLAGTP